MGKPYISWWKPWWNHWKTLYFMVKTHGFPVKKKSRGNQSNDRRWKPTSGTQFSWGSCRNKMARARGFGASNLPRWLPRLKRFKRWLCQKRWHVCTWWLIPLSKWVITPIINGISRVNPLITGVIWDEPPSMGQSLRPQGQQTFEYKLDTTWHFQEKPATEPYPETLGDQRLTTVRGRVQGNQLPSNPTMWGPQDS